LQSGGVDFAPPVHFYELMKSPLFCVTLLGALLSTEIQIEAQTNSAVAVVSAADKDLATLEKHIHPILSAVSLNDAAKEAKVRAVAVTYVQALKTWHAANDAQIKSLWSEFNTARSKQSVADANDALAKIDAVYAGFRPQREQFLADLAAVLTPVQVEAVKDALTINKVKITYDVYLQIFPALTDAQKAVVLQNLKAAREEALDCEAMTEKSAFFKKYKIKIEDEYLTAQGYDPKQARKDFAAKQKAEAATKKPSNNPPAENKQ